MRFFIGNAKNFTQYDQQYILDNTDVTIHRSNNNKIVFYSWEKGFESRLPSFDNIICYQTADKKVITTLYSGTIQEKIYGNDILIDSVYQLNTKIRTIYLISGNTILAPAHVLNTLTACEISGNNFTDSVKVFCKGNSCESTLEFSYFISTKMLDDPKFSVDMQKNVVYMPVLDSNETSIVRIIGYTLQ